MRMNLLSGLYRPEVHKNSNLVLSSAQSADYYYIYGWIQLTLQMSRSDNQPILIDPII